MLKVLFFAAAIAVAQSDNEVEKAFKDSGIVPDMLSVPPKYEVQIEYLNSSIKIHLGNEVKPSQIGDRPDVIYSGGADFYYTFLMTDLDAPSRENHTAREYLHCIIGNIVGNSVPTGEVIVDYLSPAPPQGFGLHRYVFLVFVQESRIIVDPEDIAERANFSTKSFMDKYGLILSSGNFLVAQNENN